MYLRFVNIDLANTILIIKILSILSIVLIGIIITIIYKIRRERIMNYENIREAVNAVDPDNILKLVVSKPASGNEEYEKIRFENNGGSFHISSFTKTQAFHRTVKASEFADALVEICEGHFRQINMWGVTGETYDFLISKKGQVHVNMTKGSAQPQKSFSYNREKNYIIREGTIVPPLMDMGIFTKEGKVVKSMGDKFKQINRFIELIDDACKNMSKDKIHIIDFGCGKSYLTFIVYYYFTEVKKIPVEITGLDLKRDVIAKYEAAKKYGYSGLRFEVGDINGFRAPFDVDIVMTLHACDTATDYALYNAIRWNADMIFSVPCCQHELNKTMESESLNLLTRYGVIKERTAALMTDAIRANLLEYSGYKTQLIEFIDLEHTPKNILIRAIKRPRVFEADRKMYLKEVESVMKEFNVSQTLYSLLVENETK